MGICDRKARKKADIQQEHKVDLPVHLQVVRKLLRPLQLLPHAYQFLPLDSQRGPRSGTETCWVGGFRGRNLKALGFSCLGVRHLGYCRTGVGEVGKGARSSKRAARNLGWGLMGYLFTNKYLPVQPS